MAEQRGLRVNNGRVGFQAIVGSLTTCEACRSWSHVGMEGSDVKVEGISDDDLMAAVVAIISDHRR